MVVQPSAQTVLKLCTLRSCMKTFCVDRISQEEWMQFQEYAARGSSYELIEIETSLLPHPFYIRRHTSDFKNLHQIFVSEEYQFLDNSLYAGSWGYIGLASLYAISKCKLQSVVVVEPDIDNFKLLQLNTRPYSNIQCINAAVWTHKTSVSAFRTAWWRMGIYFCRRNQTFINQQYRNLYSARVNKPYQR